MYREFETYDLKHKKKVTLKTFIPLVVLLIILGGIQWFIKDPIRVEMIYSRKVFPIITYIISRIQFFTKASVGELIILVLIVTLVVRLILKLVKRKPSKTTILGKLIKLAEIALLIVVVFQISWGINYHRQSLEENFDLVSSQGSVDVLKALNMKLIDEAQSLRIDLAKDEDEVTYYPDGLNKILDIVGEGYVPLNETYPWLHVPHTKPKKLLSSRLYTYLGISGVYNPFTSEANINVDGTDHFKPLTAAHELAHQVGIGAEDEANFIAYLVCINHDDEFIQYSGYLGGILYTLRAIHKADPNGYAAYYATLDEGVKKDLNAHSAFWRSYDGFIEEIGDKVNDTYLKANSQSDGVVSYSKMVELLLAWYHDQL